jgi:hypothetical protein
LRQDEDGIEPRVPNSLEGSRLGFESDSGLLNFEANKLIRMEMCEIAFRDVDRGRIAEHHLSVHQNLQSRTASAKSHGDSNVGEARPGSRHAGSRMISLSISKALTGLHVVLKRQR